MCLELVLVAELVDYDVFVGLGILVGYVFEIMILPSVGFPIRCDGIPTERPYCITSEGATIGEYTISFHKRPKSVWLLLNKA